LLKKREIICVLLIAGIMGLTLIPAEALSKRETRAAVMETNTAVESFTANDVETGNRTIVVEWPTPSHFGTGFVGEGGIIQVNFTVLPYSNASVIVDCSFTDGLWIPEPIKNVTFAVGETFSETYTMTNDLGMEGNNLYFIFSIPKGGDNATIFISYRIIEEGTFRGSGFGFLLTTGVLVVMGAVVLFVSRKKKS